ncbi:MAG: indole-3-glycerol phosphate synthase TrpC [Candidatus Dormibacteria bacterium]
MPDLLAEIFAAKARRLEAEMAHEPLPGLRAQAGRRIAERRSLLRALTTPPVPRLIAEMKRASPSAGVLAEALDPGSAAALYQAGGAVAISVLTEADHFQGHLADLEQARSGTRLPVLRKDFLTTPYQVVQSAAHGADAVLAIVAGLTDGQLRAILSQAREFELDVLVEVHDLVELGRALNLDCPLIGVNNRDLRTLEVDLNRTERLARQVPSSRVLVSESGLTSPADIHRLQDSGVSCFLVGEALLRDPDPVAWLTAARARPTTVAPGSP